MDTTLCYIEHNNCYLMLYRNKKAHDISEGKWLGVGGKFLPGETAETCLLREVCEETGFELASYDYRGIVHFLNDIYEDEEMHLYTAAPSQADLARLRNAGNVPVVLGEAEGGMTAGGMTESALEQVVKASEESALEHAAEASEGSAPGETVASAFACASSRAGNEASAVEGGLGASAQRSRSAIGAAACLRAAGVTPADMPVPECSEGTFAWIPLEDVAKLPLWEGDRIFLAQLAAGEHGIDLTVSYHGDELISVRNGADS